MSATRDLDCLVALTAERDRDVLDLNLTAALFAFLKPLEVAVYRAVGEPDQTQHWLTRSRQVCGNTAPQADSLWVDQRTLPLLQDHPERQACLHSQQPISRPGCPALACMPLAAECQGAGVLEVLSEEPLDSEATRLVAQVLQIWRNIHSLLDYSERDTLTGLLNRKTFDDSFWRMVRIEAGPDLDGGAATELDERRHDGSARFWLGLIDIDHFKRVNDTYGHLIGDEVLLLLSQLMRANFRLYDQLYRFGGEEFLVLLRCDTAGHAASAFERLRSRVEAHVFPQVGSVTLSAGLTSLRSGDTPTAAFERADKALYVAKQTGRNQVADYATLVAHGKLAEAARDSAVELF